METDPLVHLDDVTVRFGDLLAVQDVTLGIDPGEIFVIMGPSGSGKSTLFRAMLGLVPPSAGVIRLFGQDLSSVDHAELYDLRRRMGVAFQGGALLNSMTVLQNIELPLLRHTDLAPNTIRIMSRMKLEMMNLIGVENRMPSELSGGMLKRASLARAVIMDPKLLFFDEPSSGLDPISAAELDELILHLRDAHHMTIVVVTHELSSAQRIADRIAILDEGRLVVVGPTKAVRRHPEPVVQDLFHRRPASKERDLEAYVERLTL